MKKIILFAAAGLAVLASCNRLESGLQQTNEADQEIAIKALSGTMTKAGISSTAMPTTRQIVVSAYQYSADPAIAAVYFTGITFTYDRNGSEGKWREGKYWPSEGTLDFLAFSCEGYQSVAHPARAVSDIVLQLEDNYDAARSTYPGRDGINPTSVTWGADGVNARRVVIDVPDNSDKQDDVLYAAANGKNYTPGSGTPMQFKHAQAALAFVAWTNTSYNDTINVGITLEKITLDTVMFSGRLTVNNPAAAGASGDLTASWSNLGATKTNFDVASIQNYPLPVDTLKVDINSDKYPFGINYCNTYSNGFLGEHPWAARNAGVILPPQPQASLIITYVIHNGMDAEGNKLNNRQTYTYHPAAGAVWKMNTKYIYNIRIGLQEISITPTVSEWDNNSQNINFEPVVDL